MGGSSLKISLPFHLIGIRIDELALVSSAKDIKIIYNFGKIIRKLILTNTKRKRLSLTRSWNEYIIRSIFLGRYNMCSLCSFRNHFGQEVVFLVVPVV